MNRLLNNPIIVVSITVAVFIIALFAGKFSFLIISTDSITTVLATLANFALIALFIERAVQILRNIHLDNVIAETTKANLKEAQREAYDISKILTLNRRNLSDTNDKAVEEIRERIAKKITAIVSLLIGFVLALAGIRLIATLLPQDALVSCHLPGGQEWTAYAQDLTEFFKARLEGWDAEQLGALVTNLIGSCDMKTIQRSLFGAADVVVTGAILAGGSASIHDLIELIKGQFGQGQGENGGQQNGV